MVCRTIKSKIRGMKALLRLFLITGLVLTNISAQSLKDTPKSIGIAEEPHHVLLFENDVVRVFRLKLKPKERTMPHRHEGYFAYFSLSTVSIENEVRGHMPVPVILTAGEVHTSKGGFNVAERNSSSEPADIIIVEPKKHNDTGFDVPMGGLSFHNAGSIEWFENATVRGYAIAIAAGGKVDRHKEHFDRLLIAISDLNLSETGETGNKTEIQLNPGDVRWFSRGTTHDTTNAGDSPAGFLIFEFH